MDFNNLNSLNDVSRPNMLVHKHQETTWRPKTSENDLVCH